MSNTNAPHDTDPRPAVGGAVERVVRPGSEARWYCVSREGLATLCKDEADAHETAGQCDKSWPLGGPHRAVLLGDVAAERDRCCRVVAVQRDDDLDARRTILAIRAGDDYHDVDDDVLRA